MPRHCNSRVWSCPSENRTYETGSSSAQDTMSPSVEEQAIKFEDPERRLSDYVYALLDEKKPDVELVFFHGLQIEDSKPSHAFWRTWKMRNSEECWPEWLLPQLLDDYKPRVLSVSYEARPDRKLNIGSDCTDEYLISECLLHDLILHDDGVGQKANVPVFLLGHDLGGTLIKHFVVMVENRAATENDGRSQAKLKNFLERLKSVFFYATPHSGSETLAGLVPDLEEDSDLQNANHMLRLLQVLNKDTSRINQTFANYRQQDPSKRSRFSAHAVHPTHQTLVKGKYVMVVTEGADRSDIDDYYSEAADHFSVCQPTNVSSTPLQILVNDIKLKVQEASRQT